MEPPCLDNPGSATGLDRRKRINFFNGIISKPHDLHCRIFFISPMKNYVFSYKHVRLSYSINIVLINK